MNVEHPSSPPPTPRLRPCVTKKNPHHHRKNYFPDIARRGERFCTFVQSELNTARFAVSGENSLCIFDWGPFSYPLCESSASLLFGRDKLGPDPITRWSHYGGTGPPELRNGGFIRRKLLARLTCMPSPTTLFTVR